MDKIGNITLRHYQRDAVQNTLHCIKTYDNNSLIVLPTGAGKSIVVAAVAGAVEGNILVLQPSKEILEQNMKKLALYVPEEQIGVYSASFKRKEVRKYTFATIQSVYKVPELFEGTDLVLIDECHLVNQKKESSMFARFLKAIGNPVTIGLTASPFRNVQGYANVQGIVSSVTTLKLINRMNPRMWNRVAYHINSEQLVEEGFLVPLKYYSRTLYSHQRIPLNKSRSDFDLEAFSALILPHEEKIVISINEARKHRKAVLVFCSSLEQAERMSKVVKQSAFVSGKTKAKERDRIINEFKDGTIQVVFNVGVLTTGFDFPELDCIYLLRPTRSLSLYYQMLGRGVRTAPGKKDCVVIDYSGSYESLGKIEDIKLVKEKLWELYSNGEKVHGKEIFTWTK